MNVPKGFKQTEVGVIPQDWEIVELWQLADFLDGQRKPIKSSDREKMKGIYPYYGASGIIDYVNNYIFDDELILLGEDGENILSRNLRLAFIVRGKVWVNNHAHVLKAKDGCSTAFLAEKLESLNYDQYNSGTAQPKITKGTCAKIKIPLPPTLAEQRAIATALSDMDALIEGVEKLLEKKRRIKQGAMQELLKPKAGWKETKLGAISHLYQPETISEAKFTDEGYLVYGANGIIGRYSRYNHENWQIIITCRGSTCGTVNKTRDKVWITGNAMVVNVHNNQRIDKLFLFHLLKHQDFRSCITGSGQPQIVRSPLFDYILHLPKTLQEQAAIAAILSDMDSEIEQLETQLTKYRKLKTGMMQELLTGKKRLL